LTGNPGTEQIKAFILHRVFYMRKSRALTCFESSGLVHKFWKCHNSEFLLKSYDAKALYSQHTTKALKHQSLKGKVYVQAFCYMNNHVHMLCGYSEGSSHLSKFMQRAHASFGAHFNRKHNRTGKVAVERPKTPVVEDGSDAQMDVHMYIEANPLRAGIVRNLKQLRSYRFSSYQYYAYGIESHFTKGLTAPKWYLSLGDSAEDRQKNYRVLFKEYLERTGWIGKAGNRTPKEEQSRSVEEKSFMKDIGSRKFLKRRQVFYLKYRNIKDFDQELKPTEILEKFLEAT